jgi:hypothetical protein
MFQNQHIMGHFHDISMTFPWTFHMIQATKAARLLVKNRSFLASKIAEKNIPILCAF